MDKRDLWHVALASGFLLGLFMACTAIQGMRRGSFRYRRNWLNRGEDGALFWAATILYAAAGLMLMACAVSMTINPPGKTDAQMRSK
jgi:hypothetical protein